MPPSIILQSSAVWLYVPSVARPDFHRPSLLDDPVASSAALVFVDLACTSGSFGSPPVDSQSSALPPALLFEKSQHSVSDFTLTNKNQAASQWAEVISQFGSLPALCFRRPLPRILSVIFVPFEAPFEVPLQGLEASLHFATGALQALRAP